MRGSLVVTVILLIVIEFTFGISVAAQTQTKSNGSVNESTVIEVLEKYIGAMGGLELLRSIKTSETVTEQEVMGSINKIYRLADLESGRFYQLQETPTSRTELGFDGKRVWRRSSDFRGYLPDNDPQAKAVTKARRQPLYEYEKTKQKFNRLPNETIDGKEYFVLTSTSTDSLDRKLDNRYHFDALTFLLRQETTGGGVTQTTRYDDYRKINGRMVAFATAITNPQVTVKTKVISVKYNLALDVGKFEFKEVAEGATPPSLSGQPELLREGGLAQTAKNHGSEILSEAARMETFETVWNKVNSTYWDRTFGGVDWKRIHDKYVPLVKSVSRSDDYHELLNLMLAELGRSHFAVSAPGNTLGLHSELGVLKRGASTGLSLRWVDSQLLVFGAEETSPAYAAGIRKGFVITKINGKTIDEIYADFRKIKRGFQPREEFGRVRAASEELTQGIPESRVRVDAVDGNETPAAYEIVRRERSLISSLQYQSKRISPDVGYVKFNLFLGELLQKFQDSLAEFSSTRSLIIDLRGNSGGAGGLAPGIANLLSATSGTLGMFIFRYEDQKVSYPGTGERAYKGRVILLVDELTGSTAEVFAGGLQEQKRAIVMGSTTAGAVLPSLADLLPNGGGLMYVVANYQTPKGVALEGRGVIPDVPVKPLRKDLLAGRDTALEGAMKIAMNLG